MTFPSANIETLNTRRGEARQIARTLLFVGVGASDVRPTAVDEGVDLSAVLGAKDTILSKSVKAFFANAGQNSMTWVAAFKKPTDPATTITDAWSKVVMDAQKVASVEGVVVVLDDATQADIQKAQELRTKLINTRQRRTWFILNVRGCGSTERWADYLATMTALQQGIAAEGVQLTPSLWGNEPGILAGRLCNRSVTLADSPARVATGALAMMGRLTPPEDGEGVPLSIATLKALNKARFSVPVWYEDYEGCYWADGVTLDVDGGDYQAIEYLRVADEIARQVRLMAIPKIADRSLNSTPGSIATHEQLFARPMRNGARSLKINGVVFPGLCMSPREGDVKIIWVSETKVQLGIVVRPYNCPKEITINIMLDKSGE
ncbi:DUF2586 family protein [Salmonella enterica subsp. diarizonae]|nr:DUF2586 family protein [Salmonella enterica subsp. diarizonae]